MDHRAPRIAVAENTTRPSGTPSRRDCSARCRSASAARVRRRCRCARRSARTSRRQSSGDRLLGSEPWSGRTRSVGSSGERSSTTSADAAPYMMHEEENRKRRRRRHEPTRQAGPTRRLISAVHPHSGCRSGRCSVRQGGYRVKADQVVGRRGHGCRGRLGNGAGGGTSVHSSKYPTSRPDHA